jgi:hypothetical protein
MLNVLQPFNNSVSKSLIIDASFSNHPIISFRMQKEARVAESLKLQDIDRLLMRHDKSLSHMPLPQLPEWDVGTLMMEHLGWLTSC